MSDVIQRLLEVERQAREIIEQAEREADQTVQSAREEARRVVAEGVEAAQREANELLEDNARRLREDVDARLEAERAGLQATGRADPDRRARAVQFTVDAVALGEGPDE